MEFRHSEEFIKDRDKRAGLIPTWRFDFAGLTPRQRIDAWNEACLGFYDVTMDVEMVARTRAAFSWHRLDGLMFSSGLSFPHVARRNVGHTNQQKDFVRLLFSNEAGSRILTGEQCADLDAGAIHLIDYSRPYVHLRTECIDLSGVYVPHDAIGYDPSRHPAYMRVGLETPVGQVLSGAFSALAGQLDDLVMVDAPALATGLSDLIRALVLSDPQGERGLAVMRSARREAMRAYIERHLHDAALGIASLCQRFGASRATIYRDFEALGGIAEFVMKRRLERALADLADCEPARGAVTAIAERWGFESLQHFSHRFKAQFGISPSDVLGLGRTDANEVAGVLSSRDPGVAKVETRLRLASWFSEER